ncbi:ATP-binding protein [Massilia jejuensis]|uniref:histidine kinase n=1 Tax=Massilia jejuensis TaxID=648894 RepID=A0ABW0PHL7_9BURK
MKTRTYLLLMLAAIVVPVAFLSLSGLYMLLQSERESRIQRVAEIAHSTSLLIDSEIMAAEASIRTVVNSPSIQAEDFAELHRLLSATRTSPLSWTMIADYAGKGVVNTLVPYGTPLAVNSGSWAAKAYDAQATSVGGYFFGTRSKRGVVSVNVPVPAALGKKYVITQIFDPHYFNRIFHKNTLQAGWIIGVFDANGISIARNVNADRLVGSRVNPALYGASRQGTSGMLRHMTRDGVDVYDVFVRSALTGWTVAIGLPVAEVEHAARVTTFYAALALLSVLGGAVGIAVFVGRRIDKSLRDATSAAQALAHEKMVPVAPSRLKEVNTLLAVLHDTGLALTQESAARVALEAERERLLANERAARQQAEAQSEAKDHFVSMLSHELRNPLAAISGAASVVRLPNLAPARKEKAWEIVDRQLRHLTHILDDLLDVRRVMSGKVTLQRLPVDIGEILGLCCQARMMSENGQHAWSVATQEAWVLGDRTRLEQVFDNLLTNAMKYTPAGGTITVRNTVAGSTAVIEVSDTGAGIEPEVMPFIFDSLTQGPTTLDRAQGGLGLGLSIARGLVHLHGGTIGAHSQGLGSGSAFRVCLPLAGADVAAPASQPAADATPARSAPPDCAHRTAPFPP